MWFACVARLDRGSRVLTGQSAGVSPRSIHTWRQTSSNLH
jgi:hypothetical protein